MKQLEYNGYTGTVEFCSEDHIYHGEVTGMPHTLILYHGDDLAALECDFREAIDFHLECEQERLLDSSSDTGLYLTEPLRDKVYSYAKSRNKTPHQAIEEVLIQFFMPQSKPKTPLV
jgi:predicted HicB family RNase H-like nuclease